MGGVQENLISMVDVVKFGTDLIHRNVLKIKCHNKINNYFKIKLQILII
jgi:hypothetical protein